MNLSKLRRRLTYLLRPGGATADLAEEMEFHRALTQQRLEQSGMTPDEAAVASRRLLGNTTLAREDARAVWLWPAVERVWQDIRFGLRTLRHQPTFAVTSIVTLMVGIAATTTVFSVVESELWRPLPFSNPRQLIAVFSTDSVGDKYGTVAAADFLEMRGENHSLTGLAATGQSSRRVLRGRAVPEFVRTMPVTTNLFSLLGATPALGRNFGEQDEAGNAALISDSAWRRLFSADPGVVGRAIVLDDLTLTVAGVLGPQARLEFAGQADIFTVFDLRQALTNRSVRELSPIGRLKPDTTRAAAEADLKVIAARQAKDYPDSHRDRGIHAEGLAESFLGFNRRGLFFFLGAAVFLLILSAVNVANLLLARALSRQREFAIRSALGGGRPVLVRQLIVEGLLLAAPATAGGLLAAQWALDLVPAVMPPNYLIRSSIAMDGQVVVAALLVCGLVTICFGIAPAFLTKQDLNSALAQGGRTLAVSPKARFLRRALVVGEMTIAFILVFSAGLFLKSFDGLRNMPLGFEPDGRLSVNLNVSAPRYGSSRDVLAFANQLVEQAASVPGITTATVASSVPLGSGPSLSFIIPGRPRPAPGSEPRSLIRAVSNAYFRTFAIRSVAGREFNAGDNDGAPRVAIINQTLARRHFPDGDAIGRYLELLPSRTPWIGSGPVQIVGVVANSKDVGMNEVDFADVYLPFAQAPSRSLALAVNAAVPLANVVEPVRNAVHTLDHDLPIISVRTMQDELDRSLRGDRFNLVIIAGFAVAALVLASVGIYGAIAYAVQQRTPEFGLRRALGARTGAILSLALGQSLRLAIVGAVAGLALCLVLARLIGDGLYLVERQHEGLLYGVRTTDPSTLAGACLLLLTVALLAAATPARRAALVDPIIALKGD